MSNEPATKSGEVGYWKVPGPLSSPAGSVASITTCAPGVVVPITVTEEDSMTAPAAGAVIEMGTLAGGAWFTYRSAVIDGCSSARPAPRSRISRNSWACAHDNGEAEPAAFPSVNPIDAVVGSDPYGEAGRSGFSQSCSGTRPTPDEKRIIAVSSPAAPLRFPEPMSDSARSPESTGHRCPVPWLVVGHGSPWPGQVVWLGW